jgi:integrase
MYVIPHIGGRQLYSLDKRVIQEMYKTLLKEGGANKKPLSPTTVRTVHRVIRKAFADLGIDLGSVRQPRPAELDGHGRKGVWTPKRSKQFLKVHRDSGLYAAWALAVVAGTRRGEIAGLRWSKVDLEGGIRRAVAIGPAMVQVLRAHKARQGQEKADAGLLYHDKDYVFPREDGEPYYPRYFTDQWEDACNAAGVPVIVLHDARHTSATAGADAEVPEHVMQKRLGHADARTTRDVYTLGRGPHFDDVWDHAGGAVVMVTVTGGVGVRQPLTPSVTCYSTLLCGALVGVSGYHSGVFRIDELA